MKNLKRMEIGKKILKKRGEREKKTKQKLKNKMLKLAIQLAPFQNS
jgi:hypothetical protein